MFRNRIAFFVICLFFSSYSFASDQPTPEEKAYTFRDGLFHTIHWKFGKMIQAKSQSNNDAFKKHASDMAFLSALILEGFEIKNSIPEGSRAKKEIWEKWSEFEKRTKTFQDNITDIANSGDAASFNPKKFGSENCGGCHRKFKERD